MTAEEESRKTKQEQGERRHRPRFLDYMVMRVKPLRRTEYWRTTGGAHFQSGGDPRVGQNIDYYLEKASGLVVVGAKPSKQGKPNRTTVEQWHLDAARQMLKRLPSR
jgi:hypothetical protein